MATSERIRYAFQDLAGLSFMNGVPLCNQVGTRRPSP
jgi:hypothetical protein